MKLWDDGQSANDTVERFTVGTDPSLDLILLPFDVRASIAHARMLASIKVITNKEFKALEAELLRIIELWAQGEFIIRPDQEDCHTAIEEHLTTVLGDLGKKIHTGRSRNDQILVALRMFSLTRLAEIESEIQDLDKVVRKFARKHKKVPIPGYTHTRAAMPSSVGMWANALSDCLQDDLELLAAVWHILDQNPLGSGAGYGVPLPLDREMTAAELRFSRVQENPIYCQHSRGKFEAAALHVMSHVLYDLNRVASDIILFSMPEFGYLKLPDALCTGSSIMPQKKNPDVLELIRGHFHEVAALEQRVFALGANLIGGYHRDMQLSKWPLMRGFEVTVQCLKVAQIVFAGLEVDTDRCKAAMSPDLFAAEEALKLVMQGVPFRDAYHRVKKKF